MRLAKVGDELTSIALVKLMRISNGVTTHKFFATRASRAVYARSDGEAGQWLCIDCGELPLSKADAVRHSLSRQTHRLAWRNFVADRLESRSI